MRTTDRDAVVAAVGASHPAIVSEAENGWVSVYVEGMAENPDHATELAARFSEELRLVAISFWIYDSDIVRYWLHDSGKLTDQYNSWPAYFEGAEARPEGGSLEVLARLCAPGFGLRDLRRALAADQVFADDLASQLARILGIGEGRVVADYRDLASNGDEDGLRQALSTIPTAMRTRPLEEYPDDLVALVRAAADGDLAEIAQLGAAGVALDDAAPGALPQSDAMSGLGIAEFKPEMTPLIAAVLNRQSAATAALLDLGADPDVVHEVHGSAVHVAAGMANVDILEMLLDREANPNRHNAQGLTPLQALAANRQGMEFIEAARSSLESLGVQHDDLLDQLAAATVSPEDWTRCEDLLRSRGAES